MILVNDAPGPSRYGKYNNNTPLGLAGTFLLLLPVPGICETEGYKKQKKKEI